MARDQQTAAGVLALTCGHPDGSLAQLATVPGDGAHVRLVDQYALDDLPLEMHKALLISMHADQRFLSVRADRLDRFVGQGGTVVVSGHVAYPFLAGLTPFQPIENYRLGDLVVNTEAPHPVWDGVIAKELMFRRGVAGFYGRGWHRPPDGAAVHHSLGADRRPLDFTYRIGLGRVLFHGGNDLWQYGAVQDSTRFIAPQLLRWLLVPEVDS